MTQQDNLTRRATQPGPVQLSFKPSWACDDYSSTHDWRNCEKCLTAPRRRNALSLSWKPDPDEIDSPTPFPVDDEELDWGDDGPDDLLGLDLTLDTFDPGELEPYQVDDYLD